MRRLSYLFVLLLILTACSSDSGDDEAVVEPSPTPTEMAVEEPDPTPSPTPTEVAEPTPEAEPTPTEEPAASDDDPLSLEEYVDQVVQNVVELRGLEMREELNFEIMSRGELQEMLEEEVEIEQSEIDLYWIFRLIEDRDIDLESILVEAQAADIYGFYDPEVQETYLIADDENLSALEEVFLAHEIVHALQDQHFDLGQLLDLEPDYDRAMAFRAMIEGDAVLTQELYAQQYLDDDRQMEYLQEAMSILQDQDAAAAIENLPPYFLEAFSFPYSAGPMFMLQAYDGDFESIDAVLADPPTSTQQVMNPGGYLAGEIEAPLEIELPDLSEHLGDDWELYDEGTFGVFDLTILLEENGAEDADGALEAWGGSSIALYETGEHVLGVLATRWQSEEGAALFEDALRETMAGYDEEDGIWIGDGRYHAIVSNGDTVNLTSSSDPDALVSIINLN